MPEPALRKILIDAGFSEIAAPPRITLVPGIEVGVTHGPIRSIGVFKSVRAGWNPERYALHLEGEINDVIEAFEKIRISFKEHAYDLDKICHYYEIVLPDQPVDIKGYIKALRKTLNFSFNLGGEIMMPYEVSFSNAESPVSQEYFYKWFHISIKPDANNTENRAILQIIKRETNGDSVVPVSYTHLTLPTTERV